MTRIAAILLALVSAASAADLKVLMVGALNPGFANNAAQYKKDTGGTITTQVNTAPALIKEIAAGATADILIAPDNVIDEAAKEGKVDVSTRTPVAKIGIGIVVPAGKAVPNISTVDAFKQALLNADSVCYNRGSSGLYIDKMLEQIGVADQIKSKVVRFPNAAQVVRHAMAATDNEIAFAPLPEVMTSDPKKLLSAGPLPAPIQNYTSYSAVVMTGANAAAARDFIHYLTEPAARRTFAASGVD